MSKKTTTAMEDRNLPPNHIKWMAAGFFALAIILFFGARSLSAGKVSLTPKIMQRGWYQQKNCAPADEGHVNECLCKADIVGVTIKDDNKKAATKMQATLDERTPQPSAAENEAADSMSGWCGGEKVSKNPPESTIANEESFKWKRVYESKAVLTMLSQFYSYGAGAAHGMSGEDGITFWKKTGKVIEPLKLASDGAIEAANDFIANEFRTALKDQLFDETLSSAKPILTREGCDGCMLYYVEAGWNVQFSLYSVGPYSSGLIEITLPKDIFPPPTALVANTKRV